MENTLYVALSRQMAMKNEMDVIANNVANANTPAFRREGMLFAEYLAEVGVTPVANDSISFVQEIAILRSADPGPLGRTGNPLDLALSGDGYFAVTTPEGTRYTRNGQFRLDDQGQIVNHKGYPVQSDSGAPITLNREDTNILIAQDGTVSSENGAIGTIKTVRFDDPKALTKAGDSLYLAEGATPQPTSDVQIHQGMIEGSNVQPVLEMTRMLELMRSYQSMQKLIETEQQLQLEAINKLASVQA